MRTKKSVGTIGKKTATVKGETQSGRVQFSRSDNSVFIKAVPIRNAAAKEVTVTVGTGFNTPKELEVLAFFESHTEKFLTPPSHREAALALGYASANSIQRALIKLERSGRMVKNIGNSMARGARSMRDFDESHAIEKAKSLLKKAGYTVTLKKKIK